LKGEFHAFQVRAARARRAAAPAGAADKLKAEEVIAHHLDAVGTPEARTAGRNLEGAVAMTAPASGGVAGSLNGRFRFDSESARFALA
jgi:hypothetical protein